MTIAGGSQLRSGRCQRHAMRPAKIIAPLPATSANRFSMLYTQPGNGTFTPPNKPQNVRMNPSRSLHSCCNPAGWARTPITATNWLSPVGVPYSCRLRTNHQPQTSAVMASTNSAWRSARSVWCASMFDALRCGWDRHSAISSTPITAAAMGSKASSESLVSAPNPSSNPSSACAAGWRAGPAAGVPAIRTSSNTIRLASSIAKLSLFTEPEIKRNMGVNATKPAAPAASQRSRASTASAIS